MEELIQQPDVYWNGLRIAEPVIAGTSLVVTVCCWYAWLRLKRTAPANPVTQLMRTFFLLMGLSTFCGGLLGHAFLYRLDFAWKLPSWVLSMVSVAALGQAAILHARPLLPKLWARFFPVANVVLLGIFLCLIFATLFFPLVEIHAGFGLIVVMGCCEGYVYWKKRDPGSRLLLLAIVPLAAAAAVHAAKLSFSVWFTFFDIGHVLMCVSILMMMRGTEKLTTYE